MTLKPAGVSPLIEVAAKEMRRDLNWMEAEMLNLAEPAFIPPVGFKFIYQGGHHNLYCNDVEHIWTGGGFCQLTPFVENYRGSCDCARWGKPKQRLDFISGPKKVAKR